jgi:hypothetical protein
VRLARSACPTNMDSVEEAGTGVAGVIASGGMDRGGG